MARSPKIRVYELARELEISSKQLLEYCQALQIPARTASSTIEAESSEAIRAYIQPTNDAEQPVNLFSAENSTGRVAGEQPISSVLTLDPRLFEADLYFNREVSWLWFNARVLHEAFDSRTPLLEKLKFLAIFSSNLDEYFMVRVAGLKQQVDANVTRRSRDGLSPQEQLEAIRIELEPQILKQHQYFERELRPELESAGINILSKENLDQPQQQYLANYFRTQIFPVLTPLAVDPSHPFPYISNLSLNLAVVVKDARSGESHFARIKMPDQLPRFVQLPPPQNSTDSFHWCGILIEQVISMYIK